MKTFQKVLLSFSVIIFTTQVQAIMYFARPYDPNAAHWLTRDPMGEQGGQNLYCFVGNNPICHIDRYGFDTYTKTDEVWANSPGTKTSIACGDIILDAVYVDAALDDSLQNADADIYNKITAVANPGTLNSGKINVGGYLGSGFMMSFSSNGKCCCEKTEWHQSIKTHSLFGGSKWSTDYNSLPTAVDFPGGDYSGYFSHDDTSEFQLTLFCVKKDGTKDQLYQITWSSRIQVDASKSPTSTTVTLKIDN